jgi:class 3 adenylate cyclase
MPKAERQQLTVLYCEVVGAPTLIEQLGLDDYHRVWRAYQETCDLVIQRFDGYVAQYLGDRLLGYFGYLQAYDDAAQRAVHAALGLVETRKICNGRLTQEYGIQLAVRIGIHTGLVIMSEVGGRKPSGSLALDKTPQLAAQVQKLAPPGTVVISAATMRLVQGYVVCQELSSPLLSGATSLLPLWHVLRASGARHRLAAAGANRQTPQVRVFQQPAPVYQTLVQTYRQLVQLYAGWEHAPQSKAPASTHDVALYGPCDVTSLPLYCARVELSVYKSQPAIVPQCYQVLAPVVEQGVLFSRG